MSNEKCRGHYKVPEFVIIQMFEDMEHLCGMLSEMIYLHQEESKQKKHHKPYLHIREYTDVVCAEHEKKLDVIRARWKERKFSCKHFGCPGEESEEIDVGKETGKEENGDLEAKSDGMVMMSEKTAGSMLDDLLILAEIIDGLTVALKLMISGRIVPDAQMANMLSQVEAMTNWITSRWEDMEMLELS